jgi:hypothetical protein
VASLSAANRIYRLVELLANVTGPRCARHDTQKHAWCAQQKNKKTTKTKQNKKTREQAINVYKCFIINIV